MGENRVLIGLGSNLNKPIEQINLAMRLLEESKSVSLLGCSSLYSSRPQGPQDQDDYVNAVVLITSKLTPLNLLSLTQSIENKLGRIKTRHWGERTIDLDILFYNQETIHHETPDLRIPHPHALLRDFVLIPAIEIAPDWQLPDQSYLKDYLSSCSKHHLCKIERLAT